MATNYPTSLDALTNPTAGDSLTSPTHAGQHANANDAIEAIQTELGTEPSGASATVKARFEAIEANDWVTAARIAASAVGSSELADNAVDTAALQDGAVTTAKIADGAVTPAKLATTGRFTFPTGAANGYGFASGAVHLSGTGTPEGVITAAPGSTYLQTDSVTDVKGWIRWVKATGTGNTGWVAGAEADTGWRKIVSWTGGVQDGTDQIGTVDTAQYSMSGTGSIYIHRIGQYVEWWIHGTMVKTNSGANKLFTVDNRIPSGFRSDGGGTYGISVPMSREINFMGTYGVGDTPAFDSVSAGRSMVWGSFRHFTSNSWPTSLPGVAA